jgi:streptogrisin C
MRRTLLAMCALAALVLGAAPATAADTQALLIGGDYFAPSPSSSVRCVVGFIVRNPAGQRVIYTSAPCTGPVGTYGTVPIPSGDTATPYVRGPAGTLLTVVGAAQAPVGATVCLSGPVGGHRCGTLLGRNQTLQFADGRIVRGVARTSICVYPGESGAPFTTVSGTGAQAQGVLLVGEPCGGSGNGYSYFFPVTTI